MSTARLVECEVNSLRALRSVSSCTEHKNAVTWGTPCLALDVNLDMAMILVSFIPSDVASGGGCAGTAAARIGALVDLHQDGPGKPC